jgi:hypothetical protein
VRVVQPVRSTLGIDVVPAVQEDKSRGRDGDVQLVEMILVGDIGNNVADSSFPHSLPGLRSIQ